MAQSEIGKRGSTNLDEITVGFQQRKGNQSPGNRGLHRMRLPEDRI
jgi:hypothetical protein